ncbi:MAG: DUF255 domain-containing protein [Bacteroidia bacterium]|nr:DUF255 domain-containing protein [Bacteroidia bacterium]
MKRLFSLSLLVALVGFFTLQGFRTTETTNTEEIEWISFEEAVKRSETSKKKIIIDVYTDWCGWCKKMDKATFQVDGIARYVNANYHAVRFDAEQKEEIVFGGKTYSFVPQGNRGYHELAAALLNGRMSYPTVVFLDENFNMIQPLPGYKGPEDMERILHFYGDNAFKEITWDEFAQSFTSQL